MDMNSVTDALLNQALPNPTFSDSSQFSTIESFHTNGFMIIGEVLTFDEIKKLKLICDNYLVEDHSTESEVTSTEFLKNLDLSSVPFGDKVVSALQSILGDRYTVYPNFVARINRFTKWHVDNGFHSRYLEGDSNFLYDGSFKHAQCVIYLQENAKDTGGGLDVAPGTHLHHIPMDNSAKNDISLKSLIKLTKNAISLKTNQGDLILFDGRLLHRGTQPKTIPGKKYGIFWSAAKSDKIQVNSYLSYLSKRSEFLNNNKESKEFMIARYSDIRNIKFPDSFLPKIIQNINNHCLTMATGWLH